MLVTTTTTNTMGQLKVHQSDYYTNDEEVSGYSDAGITNNAQIDANDPPLQVDSENLC